MAEVGERDPSKIAKSTLEMIREYELIMRSKARIVFGTHPDVVRLNRRNKASG
jgi:hypothetical protein